MKESAGIRPAELRDPSVDDAEHAELGHVHPTAGGGDSPVGAEVRAAAAQMRGDTVVLHDELDASPLPVGKGLEQCGDVIDPRVGTRGQMSASYIRGDELADGVEVMPVAGVEVVGEPLPQLPRFDHLTIVSRG